MDRRFFRGLVTGLLVGTVLALLLLPDPAARLRRLAAGVRSLPGADASYARALGVLARGSMALRARYEEARAEARQAAEEARRALWAQFEAARKRPNPPAA